MKINKLLTILMSMVLVWFIIIPIMIWSPINYLFKGICSNKGLFCIFSVGLVIPFIIGLIIGLLIIKIIKLRNQNIKCPKQSKHKK